MKKSSGLIVILVMFLNIPFVFAQEWKNLKDYKQQTGRILLDNGCWLKKDRKRNSKTWKQANIYNLLLHNGNLKYKTISEIRDFYLWFDIEREKQGHEITAIGVAALVAGQLSKLDNYFIQKCIVRNKEVVGFGNQGSKKVLAFIFPLLKEVYVSKNIIKGQEAKDWDIKNGKIEQCQIVEVIYTQLSPKVIRKLERMAKGKGIYIFGVKKKLRFQGDIRNCKARYSHAFTILKSYYLHKKKKYGNPYVITN